MDLLKGIAERKSIRNYKPKAVPKDILRNVLEIGGQSPSAVNSQPWEFVVLTGDALEKIKQGNIEALRSGTAPNPEFNLGELPRETVFFQRQRDLGMEIFRLMDIAREDREKRAAWMERGFRYFDAPAAILITLDRVLTEDGPYLDIGAVMQTICLAALEFGLGTCIEDQGALYPDVIRQHVDIPESKQIVITIAIGYPDDDFAANKLKSTRVPIDELITWTE